MLRVTLNGEPLVFPAARTILQACAEAGVDVPRLCHDARIEPYGGCRLCIVEIDGASQPVSACDTALQDGMVIRTGTPRLQSLRKTTLALLAARYPAGAGPDSVFQKYLTEYGVVSADLPPRDTWRDDSHPYISIDMSRCISCYRCVRICEELQVQSVWTIEGRGVQSKVRPVRGDSLIESGCVSCGACVDTCPTGALADKCAADPNMLSRWTTTTCVYCATGCQMEVATIGRKVVEARPVMDAAVNQGHLCAKGRYAFAFTQAKDRITHPMIREDGSWRKASWDEAFDVIAGRFSDIIVRHGADAVGVLGSARATNEDNYVIQKFARAVLGTNNVDACARVCHQPSAAALKKMLGTGAATNSFDDIERAATIVIWGCNPTENHPIIGARIKRAVLAGAKLVVVDPRRTELTAFADVHLAVNPGRDIQLLHAFGHVILSEGLEDRAFLEARVDMLEAYRAFVTSFAPEAVAESCGVTAESIRSAARLYACSKPAMCFHGLGLTEHRQGTEDVMALINLALLTGNLGKPGAGINPLRGQNNVQGAAHMGCVPDALPGGVDIVTGRARVEEIWKVPLPSKSGLTLPDMMDAARNGSLKAIWAIGYDFYPTLANMNETHKALQNLELVVVQDLFLNETAKAFGTVFLPAASCFEKDGTFMNSDRRVQRVRKAVSAMGAAIADWRIVCGLAERMGKGDLFPYASPQAIWNEVRKVWPDGAGIDYFRINDDGLQWPCPDTEHPGTMFLHADQFAHGKRAELRCPPAKLTPEQPDQAFPFVLTTGRSLYHFNAGTMTYRTLNAALESTDVLEICPHDAARLGIADGQLVRVTSRYGKTSLPARVSERVKPGQLFATFHDPLRRVNAVTSPYCDTFVQTPEYKVTAVNLDVNKP